SQPQRRGGTEAQEGPVGHGGYGLRPQSPGEEEQAQLVLRAVHDFVQVGARGGDADRRLPERDRQVALHHRRRRVLEAAPGSELSFERSLARLTRRDNLSAAP